MPAERGGPAPARRTLVQFLSLADALPPRPTCAKETATASAAPGSATFTIDREVHMEYAAGRAAKLHSILADARSHAERHMRMAEQQYSASTASQQRLLEWRKVMSGGAEAAFSMTDNTVTATTLHLSNANVSNIVGGDSIDAIPPVLVRHQHEWSSFLTAYPNAASQRHSPGDASSLLSAPAALGDTAPRFTHPSIKDVTEGHKTSDTAAATEFAARYTTLAVDHKLKGCQTEVASLRAQLQSTAQRTASRRNQSPALLGRPRTPR